MYKHIVVLRKAGDVPRHKTIVVVVVVEVDDVDVGVVHELLSEGIRAPKHPQKQIHFGGARTSGGPKAPSGGVPPHPPSKCKTFGYLKTRKFPVRSLIFGRYLQRFVHVHCFEVKNQEAFHLGGGFLKVLPNIDMSVRFQQENLFGRQLLEGSGVRWRKNGLQIDV